MTVCPRTPQSDVAEAIVLEDMAYLAGAMLRPEAGSSNWLFIQYAAMTAYEARAFLTNQRGLELEQPMWEPTVASAARTSGKFFDDTKRMFAGVVEYFEQLMTANRAWYYPGRRLRILDRARSDIAVLTLDGVPLMLNVSGYFAAGMNPSRLADLNAAGPMMRDLSAGIAQMIRLTGADQHHTGPANFTHRDLRSWDADGPELWPQVFGGSLSPALAAAMLTVQGAATTADNLARSECCRGCQRAAFKHRYVVAYQAVLAVEQLLDNAAGILDRGLDHARAIVRHEACQQLRTRGDQRLRNGLLHLGLSDLELGPDAQLEDVLVGYTGASSASEVLTTVESALAVTARELERWCATPPPGGTGMQAVLRRPRT